MKTDKVIAVRTTKTVYRDGDNVIKLFDEHYSKADILNEALNQARVEETGLNIPKLNEVTKVNGRWAIIMDYIPGKTLQQLMDENPDKLDEYLELFVDLQMEVHSKRAPLLNKLKDKMNRKISQADLTATIRYDLHTRLEAMPKHNKVCHGDFNPSNIIISTDGTPYIIDWSHATQGNASADGQGQERGARVPAPLGGCRRLRIRLDKRGSYGQSHCLHRQFLPSQGFPSGGGGAPISHQQARSRRERRARGHLLHGQMRRKRRQRDR